MNINTINLLVSLKNASLINKDIINISVYNKFSLELLKTLYKEGLIQSFNISTNKIIKIQLRNFLYKGPLDNLNKLLSNTKKIYLTFDQISLLNSKKITYFFTTNKGILTLLECKKHKTGGILIFIC